MISTIYLAFLNNQHLTLHIYSQTTILRAVLQHMSPVIAKINKMYSRMSPFLLFVVYPPLVASVAVTREKHHIAGGICPPIQTHIIVPDLSYSCNTMLCEAMKHVYIPPDLRSASTAGSRLGSCTVYSAGPGQACEPCPSSCPWAR